TTTGATTADGVTAAALTTTGAGASTAAAGLPPKRPIPGRFTSGASGTYDLMGLCRPSARSCEDDACMCFARFSSSGLTLFRSTLQQHTSASPLRAAASRVAHCERTVASASAAG
ncbi:unnamed protein product, partial [Closterium sp. NIES-64]